MANKSNLDNSKISMFQWKHMLQETHYANGL